MTSTVEISTIFHCSLERAFKTPMLCDVTKIHTGYGMTPRMTHCLDDETWGQPGGSRRIFMAKNIAFAGGESSLDTVLARVENEYWKIEIGSFKMPSMGFEKFQGEWFTRQLADNEIEVRYRYTMYSKYALLHPLNWLFTKTIWRNYMWHALENVRKLAMEGAVYVHD